MLPKDYFYDNLESRVVLAKGKTQLQQEGKLIYLNDDLFSDTAHLTDATSAFLIMVDNTYYLYSSIELIPTDFPKLCPSGKKPKESLEEKCKGCTTHMCSMECPIGKTPMEGYLVLSKGNGFLDVFIY